MKLTPPTKNVFYVSVALALLAVIGRYVNVPFVSDYYFYFMFVAYLVLFLGNTMKGF
jgi:hypothetical protein